MSDEIPHLPDRLRALRESAGLSRGAIADAAKLDRTYYGRIESGKIAAPSWESVCAIADALGVSVESLRGEKS